MGFGPFLFVHSKTVYYLWGEVIDWLLKSVKEHSLKAKIFDIKFEMILEKNQRNA